MNVSPLLDAKQVQQVADMIRQTQREERIQTFLSHLAADARFHILRFLLLRVDLSESERARMEAIWSALLGPPPGVDQPDLRDALWRQSEWWDAFGTRSRERQQRMDQLEDALRAVGRTPAGLQYFQWVAEHPPYVRLDGIWDEQRRGAIIALGQYGFGTLGRSCEVFLARHLDDWINVQTDVIDILAALKSRLLARVAPWYLTYDPDARPFLAQYFDERLPKEPEIE